jgi:ubiquinone/menaquinone biosynthesis C-methylase UbiE
MLSRWERAYQAFETPEEEIRKCTDRLRLVGADHWNRSARIVEICCGRGNGLRAWHALGFPHTLGVDLSPGLVASCTGPGSAVVGDARALPLPDASRDVAVVQGGLHHLFTAEDVDRSLAEMARVVVPSGQIIIVEPWPSPFRSMVHFVSRRRIVRRLSVKVDALATMIEEEKETYERWLSAPRTHLGLITRHVAPAILRRRWGKLIVAGSAVRS